MDELRTGNAATILPKIAGAFQATENATLRTRMAFALFGRSGAQMIPLLAQGPEVMRRWTQELDRLAYKFTDTDDKGLTRFRMSWIGLETSVGDFINMLGARLTPVLEPVVAQFRDWIANNREWIATQISEKVGEFVRWLQQLDWRAIGQQVRDFVRGAADLIDKLGGVKGAMLAVVGITFAPVIAGLIEIGAAVAKLVVAFGTTLVAAVRAAGDAIALLNTRAMALPLFRVLALTMGLYDKAKEGRQADHAGEHAAGLARLRRADTGATGGKSPAAPAGQRRVGQLVARSTHRCVAFGFDSAGWDAAARPGAGEWRGGGGVPVLPQLVPLPGQRPGGIGGAPFDPQPLPGQPSGGFQPLRILPDNPPLFAPPSGTSLPNIYAPPAPQGAVSQQGSVDVNVRFANAPAGMQVDTQSGGSARAPPPEVGYAFGFERLGFA
ncbi:MAG TPA: hypothetical protein VMB73_30595 [Acetobacteraceae bacterium]|nr:hypothetical protein [Acetobacteraceae bacterium]